MFDELNPFNERDIKDKSIRIRLTHKEKMRVILMARQKGMNISKFIITLIMQENERLTNEKLIDFFDNDNDNDGMPF